MPRILAFVMDSAGVGALPDANAYHDGSNANTIGNVAQRLGGLRLPNFERLGLRSVTAVRGLDPLGAPLAAVRRLRARSKGNEPVTGHLDMVAAVHALPLPHYPPA